MSFVRQLKRRQLARMAPRLLAENQKLRFKLDISNSTSVLAVILLMMFAYAAGWLVGAR